MITRNNLIRYMVEYMDTHSEPTMEQIMTDAKTAYRDEFTFLVKDIAEVLNELGLTGKVGTVNKVVDTREIAYIVIDGQRVINTEFVKYTTELFQNFNKQGGGRIFDL